MIIRISVPGSSPLCHEYLLLRWKSSCNIGNRLRRFFRTPILLPNILTTTQTIHVIPPTLTTYVPMLWFLLTDRALTTVFQAKYIRKVLVLLLNALNSLLMCSLIYLNLFVIVHVMSMEWWCLTEVLFYISTFLSIVVWIEFFIKTTRYWFTLLHLLSYFSIWYNKSKYLSEILKIWLSLSLCFYSNGEQCLVFSICYLGIYFFWITFLAWTSFTTCLDLFFLIF